MGLFSGILSSIAGPVIGGLLGLSGQQSANSTNVDIANATNATSIELANSSYQRRVKDLEAAGLNPMLAYQNGGASVPQLSTAHVENSADAAIRGAGSSSQITLNSATAAKEKQDTATSASQADLNRAAALKQVADTRVSNASAAEIEARTPTYGPTISKTNADIDVLRSTVSKIASEVNLNAQQTDLFRQEVINAIKSGRKIDVETGNIQVDTALKRAEIALRQSEVPQTVAETNLKRAALPKEQAVGTAYSAISNSAQSIANNVRNGLPSLLYPFAHPAPHSIVGEGLSYLRNPKNAGFGRRYNR